MLMNFVAYFWVKSIYYLDTFLRYNFVKYENSKFQNRILDVSDQIIESYYFHHGVFLGMLDNVQFTRIDNYNTYYNRFAEDQFFDIFYSESFFVFEEKMAVFLLNYELLKMENNKVFAYTFGASC